MLPPCFQVADRLYPLVRQRAAIRMRELGVTQSEIGRRLGVSQAMVSKYLKGFEPTEAETWQGWVVDAMAEELATSTSPKPQEGTENPWCRTLGNLVQPQDDDERRLFEEVLGFIVRLDAERLRPLVPAVNINVAAARPGATARSDVLAFPGRLAVVGGRLRAYGPPEFGASRHLAAMLLRAREDDPDLRFVVNLRGGDAVRRALRRAGAEAVESDPDERDKEGVARFRLAEGVRAVHDPGGLHVEPALYLFDPEASQLAERVDALARAMA
ncbi:MAG: helix-turn-helix domain-containing protein [Euryarchaeota archaeon]|nr:helix-turn-helix domain-containing protein [Euryarchaeota archaeon]